MEKRLVIDRFESEWAVIEYGDIHFNFPRELLPEEVREGDIIELSILVRTEETNARKQEIRSRMERLRRKE